MGSKRLSSSSRCFLLRTSPSPPPAWAPLWKLEGRVGRRELAGEGLGADFASCDSVMDGSVHPRPVVQLLVGFLRLDLAGVRVVEEVEDAGACRGWYNYAGAVVDEEGGAEVFLHADELPHVPECTGAGWSMGRWLTEEPLHLAFTISISW